MTALLFCIGGSAQQFVPGKVTLAELQEKQCAYVPEAPAAILYKVGRTYFTYDLRGFKVWHECTYRIKIYSTDGLSHASFKLPSRMPSSA